MPLSDLVLMTPQGPARRVTLHRLQGTPPVVVLSYAGKPGHQAVPADQRLTVPTDTWPREHDLTGVAAGVSRNR